ncbi:MAG TPA: HAD family phosphatase [Deltaproteobacteria bacterium]|nr:HAD family phosphatase [Deltaproteobacteria bacterium]HQI80600.1 HAD family phosphatase [Deltaproteobacteria bacterium]
MKPDTINVVLFDFGGVLADEGFRNGLYRIARRHSQDPEGFFETARELILTSGYLTGNATEADWWKRLRADTGIAGSDAELRKTILDGFTLRDWMRDVVLALRHHGVRTAVLSDQTNWLDELDAKTPFSGWFEEVFNSFHLGKSKHDPSLFVDVTSRLGVKPGQALFIDDTLAHVERARATGLHAIWYRDREGFLAELRAFFPDLV